MVGGGGDGGADGGRSQEETRGNLRPLLLQVTSPKKAVVVLTKNCILKNCFESSSEHLSPLMNMGTGDGDFCSPYCINMVGMSVETSHCALKSGSSNGHCPNSKSTPAVQL